MSRDSINDDLKAKEMLLRLMYTARKQKDPEFSSLMSFMVLVDPSANFLDHVLEQYYACKTSFETDHRGNADGKTAKTKWLRYKKWLIQDKIKYNLFLSK